MFENSGAKLKVLAWILFFLEWIGAIASGIILWVDVADGKAVGFLYLLACVMGGFLFAWISSLILYAIGEAAEGSSSAQKPPKETENSSETPHVAPQTHVPDPEPMMQNVCPECGTMNDVARVFCSKCGARLS